MAYLIGAGFASGQETMQFFSNWGSVSGCFEIGVIFIVFLALTYVGVCYIGRTRNAADIKALYEVVGGKAGGKLLSFFVWAYNLGCYFFMFSGFGNCYSISSLGCPAPSANAHCGDPLRGHGAAGAEEDGRHHRQDRACCGWLFPDPGHRLRLFGSSLRSRTASPC